MKEEIEREEAERQIKIVEEEAEQERLKQLQQQ